MRTELESLSGLLGRARTRRLGEAAAMVRNQILNLTKIDKYVCTHKDGAVLEEKQGN